MSVEIQCKTCGALNTSIEGFGSLRCTYCNNRLAGELPLDIVFGNTSEPEYILPFRIRHEVVEERVNSYLKTGNVFADDIEQSQRTIRLVYVPVYLIEIDNGEPETTLTNVPVYAGVDHTQEDGACVERIVQKLYKTVGIEAFKEYSASDLQGHDIALFGMSMKQALGKANMDLCGNPTENQFDIKTLLMPVFHVAIAYKGQSYDVWIDGYFGEEVQGKLLPDDEKKYYKTLATTLPVVAIIIWGIGAILTGGLSTLKISFPLFCLIFGYFMFTLNKIKTYSLKMRTGRLSRLRSSSWESDGGKMYLKMPFVVDSPEPDELVLRRWPRMMISSGLIFIACVFTLGIPMYQKFM